MLGEPRVLRDLLRKRRVLAMPRFSCTAPAVRQAASRRTDPASWLDVVLARTVIGNRHDQALFLASRLLQQARLSPTHAEGWMRDYARRVPQGEGEDSSPVEEALACLKDAASHSR